MSSGQADIGDYAALRARLTEKFGWDDSGRLPGPDEGSPHPGPFDRRVIAVGGIVFAVLMALSARYGFDRDELYFLDCARHLQPSYVDQPVLVARQATPEPPRAWRAVPLLVGLAELGFCTVHGHPATIPGEIQAFVSSFALILIGLFIAGPWLTMAAARAMARWTSRPRHPDRRPPPRWWHPARRTTC